MQLPNLSFEDSQLAQYCRQKGIRELLFFGSVTRDDFRPDSDIDVIVNFEPGRKPDLFDFAGIQTDLGNLFGREVHLHTDPMIHERHRARIRAEATVAYAA